MLRLSIKLSLAIVALACLFTVANSLSVAEENINHANTYMGKQVGWVHSGGNTYYKQVIQTGAPYTIKITVMTNMGGAVHVSLFPGNVVPAKSNRGLVTNDNTWNGDLPGAWSAGQKTALPDWVKTLVGNIAKGAYAELRK